MIYGCLYIRLSIPIIPAMPEKKEQRIWVYINKIGKQLDAIKNSELGTAAEAARANIWGTVCSSVERLLSENENKQCGDVPKKAARLAADGVKLACKGAKKNLQRVLPPWRRAREMVEELSSDVDSVMGVIRRHAAGQRYCCYIRVCMQSRRTVSHTS